MQQAIAIKYVATGSVAAGGTSTGVSPETMFQLNMMQLMGLLIQL